MTLTQFVKEGIESNKTTKVIFDNAIESGFKTSKGSIRVLICTLKKRIKANDKGGADTDNNNRPEL